MYVTAILLAFTVACPAERERDCATVREILDPPPAEARRTYDYRAERASPLPPFDRLRRETWATPEVRAAVQALLDEAGSWPMYTSYRAATDPPGAADRLAELCGLHRTTLLVEP